MSIPSRFQGNLQRYCAVKISGLTKPAEVFEHPLYLRIHPVEHDPSSEFDRKDSDWTTRHVVFDVYNKLYTVGRDEVSPFLSSAFRVIVHTYDDCTPIALYRSNMPSNDRALVVDNYISRCMLL